MKHRHVSRRDFLALSAKGIGAAVISYGLMGCNSSNDPNNPARFLHGVASGDPTPSAVILWTRVTPEREGEVKVGWQVARDQGFSDLVHQGSMLTDARRDYTVKVDAQGLEAGHTYYYRFMVGDTVSALGRTKTLPTGAVDSVTLAVLSCANYPAGFFNVYHMAATQANLDAVIHLGDYIYEYGRGQYASDHAAELDREVLPPGEILSLDDYRQRYGQYRGDQDLQALHAAVPFICVWDDHEVANDAWHSGAENHNEGEGDFDARKLAGLQAYFEWLPIRPWREGEWQEIYRSFNFGDLVDLHMLDTRHVGRDQPYDYTQFIDAATGAFDGDAFLAAVSDVNRTMLGQTQLLWLQGQLLTATGRWQVLGQQVLMGRMLLPAAIATQQLTIPEFAHLAQLAQLAARAQAGDPSLTAQELAYLQVNQAQLTPEALALLQLPSIPYNLDAWDGYAYEREVIMATARSRAKDLVVLAGDTHNAWANQLHDINGNRVGVEFATSSVSSPGLEYYLSLDSNQIPAIEAAVTDLVTDLQYCNLHDRGLMVVMFTPDKVTTEWMFVDSLASREYQTLSERGQTMSWSAAGLLAQ
ncbi:alkaline phosphatase [Shewanella sp. NIFS-20-20]|uniref:alkaline phosphatase D family protein n=1 Tax=Shewanella sp. NIFS-20-20 TaxID=2853806 RepID=UPI001C48D714|nr:alkaline phosphatase D family protein [Shewanella sp. NIFS-20-20]MBV7315839.1 alkaline phosphatase D family protein [Shewanella sp. NIFS-20-20]